MNEKKFLVVIFIIKFLVDCLCKVFPDFKFKWLAEETERNLPIELDFLNEAKNIETVGKMFEKHKFVKVGRNYFRNVFLQN